MELAPAWDRTLTALRTRLGAQSVEIWLREIRPLRVDGALLVLEVSNPYYSEWIADNYLDALRQEAATAFGRTLDIEFACRDEATSTDEAPIASTSNSTAGGPSRGLGVNFAQTFANFVVGECNSFAHAAAQAVVDAPAKAYNPLFIYAASGLGKTHLMHAIATGILSRDPNARVVYVTAEDFTNDVINGIRHRTMDQVKARYRTMATVLLVDDIQFIAGKQQTQVEFFHTFNALQAAGRQIVLTSDVHPKEIDDIESRLRTRFEGGLAADMHAPNKETLLAILQQKAEAMRLPVPNDVADLLAQSVSGNIRSLEGLLTKLSALNTFYKKPLTVEFVQQHLGPLLSPQKSAQITVPAIIEAVARYHGLRAADLTGEKRTRALTRPRHIAMYVARRHTQLSFPELGREFGGRDHSTIQHGCNRIEEDLEKNTDLEYKIRLIEQGLGVRKGV